MTAYPAPHTYIPSRQAASLTGLREAVIIEAVKHNRLPGRQIHGGSWVVQFGEVRDYAETVRNGKREVEPAPEPEPEWKRCGRCGATRPASEFYKDTSRYDGLSPRCKPCDGEVRAERRARKLERLDAVLGYTPEPEEAQATEPPTDQQATSTASQPPVASVAAPLEEALAKARAEQAEVEDRIVGNAERRRELERLIEEAELLEVRQAELAEAVSSIERTIRYLTAGI